MPTLIVLAEEVLTREDTVAMLAGHGPAQIPFLRHLHQIFVRLQRLLLDVILPLQRIYRFVLQFYLFLNVLSTIVGAFVLQIKGLGEAFEVVLGVNQVLEAHLGQAEETDEVVREAIYVVAVDLGVDDVL